MKYEYKVIEAHGAFLDSEMEKELNVAGKEGWRLCKVTSQRYDNEHMRKIYLYAFLEREVKE